jgi:hypothetical protein
LATDHLERMSRERVENLIDPAEWREEWKPRLDAELAAATAERERLEQQVEASAAEVKALADLVDSAAVQGLATIKAEVAGQVASAGGIDSLRANLGLLFERFEIARMPADERTEAEKQIAAAQAAEYEEPLLSVGQWTVAMVPRAEWIGDLDGYWQEILGRVPLTINESLGTVSD